jgi:hypothetical protein
MSEIVSIISTIANDIVRFVWKILSICMHGVKIIIYTTSGLIRDVLRVGV